ncbi:MAG TPA: MFS transporter [Halothiobacillaceae bacterium]|nr:MFS transporter [Halothiobacillaceae bacterium]
MLVRANGWVAMATFAAILTGTLIGGFLTDTPFAPGLLAGIVVITIAACGLIASWFIPSVPPVEQGGFTQTRRQLLRPLHWPSLIVQTWAEGWKTLHSQRHRLRIVLLLISWFWFFGSGYLTQFPRFAEQVLNLSANQATGLIATFALSIGVGGLAVGYLSGGKPRLWLTPIGAFIIAAAAFDWFLAVNADPATMRIFIDVAITGLASGMFIVPLYSYLQKATKTRERARVIAALNVQNALAMITASLSGILFFSLLNGSLPMFFLLFGSSGALIALMAPLHLCAGKFLKRS